jgi:hypothetical protein
MADVVQTNLSLERATREHFDSLSARAGLPLVDTFDRSLAALDALLDIADMEVKEIAKEFGEDTARVYERVGRELGYEVFINKKISLSRAEGGRPGVRLDEHQFYETPDGSRLLAAEEAGGTIKLFEVKKGALVLFWARPAGEPALN